MQSTRKVNPGDPNRIRAEEFNSWQDAADGVKRNRRTGARSGGASPVEVGEVVIYNTTSAALDRYTLGAITGPLVAPPTSAALASVSLTVLDPAVSVSGSTGQYGKLDTLAEFLNRQVLTVTLPTSATLAPQLVVVAEPIPVSGIGRAYTAGVHPCQLNLTSVSQTHIKPNGQPGYHGIPLVWVSGEVGKAAVSGKQWGIVCLPAEVDATHPCRVSAVSGVSGNAVSDCTLTYDIYDRGIAKKFNVGLGPVSAKNPRFPKTGYTAATYGEYWREDDGKYVLNLFNETPAAFACSS